MERGNRSGDSRATRHRSALSADEPPGPDVPDPAGPEEDRDGPLAGQDAAPDAIPGPEAGEAAPPEAHTSSGRNLPVAAGVGVLLGGVVILTLFTVKATFLIVMGLAASVALWEMGRALASKRIHVPVVPIALGGAAMWLSEYWWTERAVLASFVLTVVAILAWRLPRGTEGYLRDVTAGVFVLAYIPLMATFLVALLAPGDGARRVLTLVIFTVGSDVGGYFAGSLLGQHPMARVISPNKTWEGLGGSVLVCLAAGAILLPVALHGHLWQGLVVGAVAVAAAILGDLVESAIKRDLKIKDMGSLLPGHGGILDRIDALLVTAPVVWVLLAAFVPGH